MPSVDLVVFFVIGLLGGAHCIGMCGPLVTVYAGRLAERSTSPGDRLTLWEVRQHLLFNVGRTLGYAVIGGLVGLLGALVFVTSATLTVYADAIRGVVGIAVGVIVIGIGVGYLVSRRDVLDGHLPIAGMGRLFAFLTSRVDRWIGGAGIVGLGAIHGLLPCPILYPAFLYAFATGSPGRGALSLAALGLGTIPAVLLYGTLIESIDSERRSQLHRVLGVMFVVLGYIPLSHGLMLFGVHLPHPDIPFYQPL